MEQPCSAVSKRQLQVRWRKVAGSKGKSSMRCSYRRRQSGKESDESSFHPAVLSKRKSNPRRAAALSHTERFRLSRGGFKPSSSAVLSGCRSPRWSHALDEWEQQHKRRQTPRTRRMLTNHNGSCSSRTRYGSSAGRVACESCSCSSRGCEHEDCKRMGTAVVGIIR
jgi:hypothetical protein